MQSTLTVVLAILILISAIASCLHKRKPSQKIKSNLDDDDLQPLGVPSRENVSELDVYPTKEGYVRAPTTESGYPQYTRLARTYRDPFDQSTPVYEEYSSNYGSSRPTSRKPSVANSRGGSVGRDNTFQYHRVESPPPVPT